MSEKINQGRANKSEHRSEMNFVSLQNFGEHSIAPSVSLLELPASTSRVPAIIKTVMPATTIVYPAKFATDMLVILMAGSTEGEAIHGNRRTRWRSSAGTISLCPANTDTPIEQITCKGSVLHCTSLDIGNALSQIEMPLWSLIDSHVFDLAQRLQYQAEHMVPLGSAYVEALNLMLTTYLRARYGRERAALEHDIGAPLSRAQREELQTYIDANIHGNISLEALAGIVDYSVAHLFRVFKEAFGMPPHRYIIGRRVEQARVLLLNRNMSMADVAYLCGFSSQAHMTMLFKRLTGMTPGAFRRGMG